MEVKNIEKCFKMIWNLKKKNNNNYINGLGMYILVEVCDDGYL